MFAKLTTDHPDVGQLFPFGGKGLTYDQLLRDDQVKAHGKRVMETVGTAVQGLDDFDLLVPILQELARRHVGYNVTKKHFEPVGAALIHAIGKGLGSAFDDDTKAAWLAVFGIVVNTMSEMLPGGDQEPLTREQKRVVQATWAKLSSDPVRHGSVMFAKLTTEHPAVGKLFPFGGKNLSYQQLLKNADVHAHGKRVMETVGAAVNGLDDLGLLVPILRELATRHIGYNVTKQHFQPVGAALLHAIKEGLGSSSTADVESAWLAVFQLIVDTMSEVLPDGGPLTSAQKELVQQTWKTLSPDPVKHGAVMFAKLVTSHPAVGKLFPFGRENLSYTQLLCNPEAQAHGRKVMETVGLAVGGLDDLGLLVPILQELAGRHVAYGVSKTHFQPVGEALLHAIREGLGTAFTQDVEEAWTAVFKIISETMSEVLPDGPITNVQKRLVQETWVELSSDPAKHGAVMFAKLITDHPSVGKLFPFGNRGLSYEQLRQDPDVHAHGTRVMQTVGSAVSGLDDLDLLVSILQELASRHVAYGVTKQHFTPVGAALMHAIKEGLGTSYNDDVEKAWLTVFQLVVETMSSELPDGALTAGKKELVQQTWKTLSTNPEKHGAVMFAKLIASHPQVGKLFPFGKKNLSYNQLISDPDVKAHGKRIMETIGNAVSGLDNLDLLVPILEELGTRHQQYGVTKKHFRPVREALMHAIQSGLGINFTTEIGDAWETVFALVTDTMSQVLPDDAVGPLTAEQIELVGESWKKMSASPGKHGAVMFARLIRESPIVGRLFPFGTKNLSYGQLIANPEVRAHGTRVMETVGHAVDALGNLDVLVPVLKDLALRHTQYHVTKQHFEPVVKALMYAIKEGLGKSFNTKVEEAWAAVLHLISETMSEVLPDGMLASNHLDLVRVTWEVLAENPEQYGAVMFAKLTTDHPLVGSLFNFGGRNMSYEQLLQNDDVRNHGRRFMGVVGNAIGNLENQEALVPMLEDLAKKHSGYGVTRQHFPVAGEALLHAIEVALGEGFTDDVKQAWDAVFQLVVDVMSEMLPDGRRSTGREIKEMTDQQRDIVQQTWQTLSVATDKHGAVMFAKLVSDYPKLGRLFPFGKKKQSYKKLLKEKALTSHGERFMNTLGQVVGGLEDTGMLIPTLHQLAVRHATYGLTKEHFQPARSALLFTLKQGLGKAAFTKEVESAWVAAFQFIEETMTEKL